MNPQNVIGYRNLATCFLEIGDYENAIAVYKRFIGVFPKDVNAMLNLGQLHVARNQIPEARTCFENALKLQPGLKEAEQELLKLDSP
jgi:protein O-GlcNAc transferase